MTILPCNFSQPRFMQKKYCDCNISCKTECSSILCFSFIVTVILNPNDFDFLLSRGCNSGQPNPRDSILERFDPISGRKSIVPAPLINRSEPTTIPAAASISTILEVDSICESSPVRANDQLISIQNSPALTSTVDERGDNETTVKLELSEKTELSICGEGDNSQASSTTETYETASTGEPLKVIKIATFDVN